MQKVIDYASNCSVCNTLQPSQDREPLNTHEISVRTWKKVATNLFSLNGDNFIVIVDYYSNFIEMERINSTSSQSVIQALKMTFGHHGILESLVSDMVQHMLQMSSVNLLHIWSFNTSPHPHNTYSPMAKQKVQ